jgi:serine/threonine protein phosphatase 1
MSHSSTAPTARRFVISDVHGQYKTLVELLAWIGLGAADQLYFVGDLVDRGSQSREVVDLVRKEGYHTIIGNHEQMMINSFRQEEEVSLMDLQSWMMNGGNSTFDSYQQNFESLMEDVKWLRQQPYFVDLGDVWLVHAGVNPLFPLSEQIEEDLCWIREGFHRVEKPYFKDKLIIIGHTITFTFPGVNPGELVQGAGWLGIDTGAYHPRSGWLTAVDLDSWQVYQCNVETEERRVRPYQDLVRPYGSRKAVGDNPIRFPFLYSA